MTSPYDEKIEKLNTALENVYLKKNIGTDYANKNVVTDSNGVITTENKPTIPSKTSDLINDSGFITSYQDLSNYVQKSQTSGLIKNDGSIDTTNYIDNTSFSSTVGSIYNNFSNYQTKKLGSGKVYQNKNLVTDNSGNITVEAKSTIPSASSTTPSADTTSGGSGSSSDFARADHTHPKSTIYAEATHTHNNYLTSHQDISGKADSSDFDTLTATVTYTDNTSETVTFYIVPTNSS